MLFNLHMITMNLLLLKYELLLSTINYYNYFVY